MSNPVLTPNQVAERYRTHRTQLMTLWITRQNQSFVTSGDLQLCDLELIGARVNLVGEPGKGNTGNVSGGTTPYGTTVNKLHIVNGEGISSSVYGELNENKIIFKTHLDHRYLDIHIKGMTQGHHFRTDSSVEGNNLQLLVPTDIGLIENHSLVWPPTPIEIEKVHLQQSIHVECAFAGTWPITKRRARFTEDWADTPGGTKREPSGIVRYFVDGIEGQGLSSECQVPANCVNSICLQFKVKPTSIL